MIADGEHATSHKAPSARLTSSTEQSKAVERVIYLRLRHGWEYWNAEHGYGLRIADLLTRCRRGGSSNNGGAA